MLGGFGKSNAELRCRGLRVGDKEVIDFDGNAKFRDVNLRNLNVSGTITGGGGGGGGGGGSGVVMDDNATGDKFPTTTADGVWYGTDSKGAVTGPDITVIGNFNAVSNSRALAITGCFHPWKRQHNKWERYCLCRPDKHSC